jgi:hypothetical protein
MKAFIYCASVRVDGTRDSFVTVSAPMKRAPMAHHVRGLSFTATGYGARIPSENMVFVNGRWRRVYVRIFSNAGTAYIGKWPVKPGQSGTEMIVRDYE